VPVLIDVVSGKMRSITASHTAEPVTASSTARKQGSEVQRNYSACFTNDGERVYVGNGKGLVSLWDVRKLEQCGSFQLPSATAVRNIQVTRDGNYVLVSETGKIRVYDSRQSTLYREFMDQVNRTQWRKCMFSADMTGNYVVGATAEKGEHAIHIWNRDNGQVRRRSLSLGRSLCMSPCLSHVGLVVCRCVCPVSVSASCLSPAASASMFCFCVHAHLPSRSL
jgi:WD40 repeat protein